MSSSARRVLVVLLAALFIAATAGAIAIIGTSIQSRGAEAYSEQVDSKHSVAEAELEDAASDRSRSKNAITALQNSLESESLLYADYVSYCSSAPQAIVYDDVTWCQVADESRATIESIRTKLAAAGVLLENAEQKFDRALSSEGTAQNAANEARAQAALSASALVGSLRVWVPLVGFLCIATIAVGLSAKLRRARSSTPAVAATERD